MQWEEGTQGTWKVERGTGSRNSSRSGKRKWRGKSGNDWRRIGRVGLRKERYVFIKALRERKRSRKFWSYCNDTVHMRQEDNNS